MLYAVNFIVIVASLDYIEEEGSTLGNRFYICQRGKGKVRGCFILDSILWCVGDL